MILFYGFISDPAFRLHIHHVSVVIHNLLQQSSAEHSNCIFISLL